MIWREHQDRLVADVEAISIGQQHRPPQTIRARCEPIACDVASRVQLYDVEAAVQTLAAIPRRACSTRRKRQSLQPNPL